MAEFIEGIVQKVGTKKTARATLYSICVNTNDQGEDEWFGCGFNKPDVFEGDEIGFEIEENKNGYMDVVDGSIEVIAAADPQPKRGGGRGNSGRGSSGGRGGSNSNRGGGRGGSSSRGGSSRGGSGNKGSSRGGNGGGASRGRSNTGGSGGGGMSKDDYWKQKEQRDIEKDEYFKEKDVIVTKQACQNTAINFVKLAIDSGAVTLPQKKADKLDALAALVDEEAARLFELYRGEEESSEPGDGGYDDEECNEDIPE